MNPTQQHNHRLLLNGNPTADHKLDKTISKWVRVAMGVILILASLLSLFLLKCVRRRFFNHRDPTAKSAHSDKLSALPTFKYGSDSFPASSSSSKTPFNPETTCAICLAEYVHGEEVRVLPKCKHMYHKPCIDQWLVSKSLQCPLCRDRTIELEVEPTRTSSPNSLDPNVAFEFLLTGSFFE
ncbi:hypothetical protein ACB092_02G147100 [Castanea dentata]